MQGVYFFKPLNSSQTLGRQGVTGLSGLVLTDQCDETSHNHQKPLATVLAGLYFGGGVEILAVLC